MDAGQETGQVVLINITVPSFTPAPLQIFLSERNGSAEIKTMEINKQLDHMAILGDHRYVAHAHLIAVLYVTSVCVKSMLHVQYMIHMLVCMCVRACAVCVHVLCVCMCVCMCCAHVCACMGGPPSITILSFGRPGGSHFLSFLRAGVIWDTVITCLVVLKSFP